jgi:hypothetical protein
MANQAEPGTMGGTGPESGSFGGLTPGAASGTAQAPAVGGAPGQAAVSAEDQGAAGGPSPDPSFHGRPVSWVAVSIIMVGFAIGGFALVFGHHGPTWWLFWVGVGVSAVGGGLALATNIFEDWY